MWHALITIHVENKVTCSQGFPRKFSWVSLLLRNECKVQILFQNVRDHLITWRGLLVPDLTEEEDSDVLTTEPCAMASMTVQTKRTRTQIIAYSIKRLEQRFSWNIYIILHSYFRPKHIWIFWRRLCYDGLEVAKFVTTFVQNMSPHEKVGIIKYSDDSWKLFHLVCSGDVMHSV